MQNQKWPPLTTTIVTQIEFELLNMQFSNTKLQIWKYDHTNKELDEVLNFSTWNYHFLIFNITKYKFVNV